MTFDIWFGIPEIRDFWIELEGKVKSNTANKDEKALYKKIYKVIRLLSKNPRYPSLHSHEIKVLTDRYGKKVWESYLENRKPAAGRIFWIYYPPGSITIIGIEQHPNDDKHSYDKITLSSTQFNEKARKDACFFICGKLTNF